MENLNEHSVNYELLGKYLAGECTPVERSQVDSWLETPENQAEFDALAEIWSGSEVVPALVNVNAAWSNVKENIDNSAQPEKAMPRRRLPLWWAAAALLVVAIGFGLVFYPGETTVEPQWLTAVNRTSEQLELDLPDGSIVTLNTGSELRYAEAFAGNTRQVQMKGEAFFEVAKNPDKPFVVNAANGAEVMVLGTQFNVREDSSGLEVFVTEGKVRLAAPIAPKGKSSRVVLTAGMQGRYEQASEKVETTDPNPNALFWKERKLVFERTPLRKVVKDLQKGFGVEVAFANEELKACRLTATFQDNSIESIFQVISETLDLQVTQDGTTFTLDGDGC